MVNPCINKVTDHLQMQHSRLIYRHRLVRNADLRCRAHRPIHCTHDLYLHSLCQFPMFLLTQDKCFLLPIIVILAPPTGILLCDLALAWVILPSLTNIPCRTRQVTSHSPLNHKGRSYLHTQHLKDVPHRNQIFKEGLENLRRHHRSSHIFNPDKVQLPQCRDSMDTSHLAILLIIQGTIPMGHYMRRNLAPCYLQRSTSAQSPWLLLPSMSPVLRIRQLKKGSQLAPSYPPFQPK